MNEMLKKLTGKNPKDFEPVAFSVINMPDTKLFKELVSQEDYLFDFVKQNVASRLAKECNSSNYLNLLNFLKYYSPSYEEFIISTFVNFADEDLTDKMLELLEYGTEDEKTYCAKFFSYIQDPLAVEILKKYAYSENGYLSSNCASALAAMKELSSYEKAIEMLDSDDEFTILDGVKFLVAYGNKNAVEKITTVMKKSSMPENIAGDLTYLCDLFEQYKINQTDALFAGNAIINGLGEILNLSLVFDFQLYDFIQMLVENPKTPAAAVVLTNAKDKFDTLTENDEYLFDETKDTKQEILDIKRLLKSVNSDELIPLIDAELQPNSLFIYTVLDFTQNTDKVRRLLSCDNQTVVLKSIEVLNRLDVISDTDRQIALKSVTDENIRSVIMAI